VNLLLVIGGILSIAALIAFALFNVLQSLMHIVSSPPLVPQADVAHADDQSQQPEVLGDARYTPPINSSGGL
jgi:hypothetical protein